MDPQEITSIDLHTAGEPLRLITGGWPEIPGETMLEKRRYARENQDHLRTTLMWEPRGHADMYGAILTKPVTPDGDTGVLFLHNEGYSTMCGHGIIAIVKAGLEKKLFTPKDKSVVEIDTPAGRVTAYPQWKEDRVESVSFLNVPSFVLKHDLEIHIPEGPTIQCDIVFGGAFYAVVCIDNMGCSLDPSQTDQLIDRGKRIKAAINDQFRIEHPSGDKDLSFLYGTIFVQNLSNGVHSRNVCIFADGEVDRSPTGTGVSGRAALHYARNEIQLEEKITIESILGTTFQVSVEKEARVGSIPGIIPRVTGKAHITGVHSFQIDPQDPLSKGFFLR
ncbi:MAG: proline racemase family protein [Planctomycetota bacterium]|nr:proline racemase family protein [Planctomycetota bacterium]